MMALIPPQIRGLRLPDFAWVPAFAGPILLAAVTVSSHASGSGLLATTADWVHLLAAAVWIGGLASLLVIMRGVGPPERARLASRLVPRVSRVAGISLGVLIVTGFYSTWLNFSTLGAFVSTAYGRTLLLKLLLVVPLTALGAFSHFVLRPRIAATTAASRSALLRQLVQVVTGEVGLGAAVPLAVAVLTITPPARVSLPAVPQPRLILAGLADDIRVRLTITPALPGWNRLEVVATEERTGDRPRGAPVPAADEVGRGLRSQAHLGRPPGRGTLGRLDVTTAFPLRLGEQPARAADSAAVALLNQAGQEMTGVGTWRQVEQITDGAGNVVVTRYELSRPHRVRFQTAEGIEGVIIGAERHRRSDSGPWQQDVLPQPFSAFGPELYMIGADLVVLGRQARCSTEMCQVVLWEAPVRSAALTGWIGLVTRRVHELLMVRPHTL